MINKKVAIISQNCYGWILSYLTLILGDNVVVPVNILLNYKDILKLLVEAGVSAIICSEEYRQTAVDIKNSSSNNMDIFSITEFEGFINNGNKLRENDYQGFITLKTDPGKMCSIVFTSGTSGESKGVMLTQANIVTNAVSTTESISLLGKVILVLPLFHMYGWIVSVFVPYLYGTDVYINTDMKYFMRDLTGEKPTCVVLVPNMLEYLYHTIKSKVNSSKNKEYYFDLLKDESRISLMSIQQRRVEFAEIIDSLGGNLECIVSGGAKLDEKLSRYIEKIGIIVVEGYGTTECAPVISFNKNTNRKFGSVGIPISCNRVEIRDTDKEGKGEIWVSGSNLMLGYFNREAQTAEVLQEGWYDTGDYGKIDADGFLHITGRKKNLIILSGGENVSPEEIETLINSINGVKENVVYGEGNLIVAEIYSESREMEKDIESDIQKINNELPSFKRIDKVMFRQNEFPKTATNKIRRVR